MISLFSKNAGIATVIIIVLSIFLLVEPVTASDNAVNWNITFNQMPTTALGTESHISELSWWSLFCIGFLLFILSVRWTVDQGADILGGISTCFWLFLSITGFYVQRWSYELAAVQLNESAQMVVVPVVYTHPAWIVMITLLMFVLSIINLLRLYINGIVKAAEVT